MKKSSIILSIALFLLVSITAFSEDWEGKLRANTMIQKMDKIEVINKKIVVKEGPDGRHRIFIINRKKSYKRTIKNTLRRIFFL